MNGVHNDNDAKESKMNNETKMHDAYETYRSLSLQDAPDMAALKAAWVAYDDARIAWVAEETGSTPDPKPMIWRGVGYRETLQNRY
jgi:hypothetical protein